MSHRPESALKSGPEQRFDDPHRRPRWRQRLVEAERGWVGGMRSGSAFFVYFFLGSVVLAAALVLGLNWIEWTISLVALSLVLTTELFHQTVKLLVLELDEDRAEIRQRALATSLAARLTAVAGWAAAVLIILGQRLLQILH